MHHTFPDYFIADFENDGHPEWLDYELGKSAEEYVDERYLDDSEVSREEAIAIVEKELRNHEDYLKAREEKLKKEGIVKDEEDVIYLERLQHPAKKSG